jgi:hypothetical protein
LQLASPHDWAPAVDYHALCSSFGNEPQPSLQALLLLLLLLLLGHDVWPSTVEVEQQVPA